MPGRPATPVQLQVLEGNPNRLTRDEIEFRQEHEIRLGSPKLKKSKRIRTNKVALKEWNRVVKLYRSSDASFVTDADVALFERRCLVFADYENVRKMRDALEAKTEEEMNFEARMQATNRIDTMLARLNEQLQAMDRDLLLTPLSRISGLSGKSKRDKESPLAKSMFGDE